MNVDIDITDVVLKTERLTLRYFKESDLEDFYEYCKVDGVGQPAGWPPHKSIEESKTILNSFIEGKRVFAIVWNENNKVIGSIGIEKYNEEKFPQFELLKGREPGYVLSKDYWGRGIATEALNALMEYLWKEVNVDFLLIRRAAYNERSGRVQEKAGFKKIDEMYYDSLVEKNILTYVSIKYNPYHSRFEVKDMNTEEAKEVISWKYEGEYEIYNYPSWEECVERKFTITDEEKRKITYRSVYAFGQLYGFFNIIPKDDRIELGVGTRPSMCGLRLGEEFFALAVSIVNRLYPGKKIRLLVRPFNKRAIACYTKCGFEIKEKYIEEGFVTPGEMYIMEK